MSTAFGTNQRARSRGAKAKSSAFLPAIACALSIFLSTMFTEGAVSQTNNDLPVLYGVKLDGPRMAIDVMSFGCTDASHFSVQLHPMGGNSYQLSILRLEEDLCRMSPHTVTLVVDVPSVANLAEARFTIMNSFATVTTAPRR